MAVSEPGSCPSPHIKSTAVLILDFLASRTVRNQWMREGLAKEKYREVRKNWRLLSYYFNTWVMINDKIWIWNLYFSKHGLFFPPVRCRTLFFFPHKNPELLEDFHKVFGLERQAMINVCMETATRTVFGSRQDRHMWVIDQIRRGS